MNENLQMNFYWLQYLGVMLNDKLSWGDYIDSKMDLRMPPYIGNFSHAS